MRTTRIKQASLHLVSVSASAPGDLDARPERLIAASTCGHVSEGRRHATPIGIPEWNEDWNLEPVKSSSGTASGSRPIFPW